MKKIILSVFCCFICISSAFSQIDTLSIEGISCNNDTGYIKLGLSQNVVIIEADEWQYQPYDSTNWIEIIDSTTFLSQNYDTLSTLSCGKYRVTVFNTTSGAFPDTVIFFVPCDVTVGWGQSQKIRCFGDSSGILLAPTFGGIVFDPDSSTFDSLGFYFPNDTTGDEYYTYQWFKASNLQGANLSQVGDTTNTLSNVSAGFYNVVVTDAIGCTDTSEFRRISNPFPVKFDSIILSNVNCFQGQDGNLTVTVSGGRKFHSNRNYNYYVLDSNNDTIYRSDDILVSDNFFQLSALSDSSYIVDSIFIDNFSSGTYSIIVEDSLGCFVDTFFTLTEPLPFQAYVSEIIPIECLSDSGLFRIDSISGGNGNEVFYWMQSNSDSNWCFELPPGNGYDIVILDSIYGCSDTILIDTLQANFEIFVVENIIDVLCYGEASGSISIDSVFGGNIPYTYDWGGVGQGTNIDSLLSGSYFLEIEDSIGCKQTFYFDINQNSPINVVPEFTPPSCFGFTDGEINVNVSGGEFPYLFNWSNGLGSTDSINGLSFGSYSLNIIDNNFCEYNATYYLNQPDSLLLYFDNYDNPIDCYGGLTVISAVISGGTGPFNFSWNNNTNTSQTVVGAGDWICEVTDNNGCIISDSITIFEPEIFFISDSSSNNPLCSNGGSASIQTTGGTQPVTYLWSTGETTQSISNILSSTCWVIATDSCGNTDSVGFNLIPYDLVTSVSYNDTNHISSVFIDPISSGSSFTYEWFDLNGGLVGDSSNEVNLCQGTYTVKTTDQSNGCFVEDTLVVEWYLLSNIVDLEITTVFADSLLWGFGPYKYLWGPSSGFATQQANICPGDHWLEVTDRDGCTIDTFFTIDPIFVNLDPADDLIECDLENLDVELSVAASGGTDPYTYLWTNGDTDSITNLSLSPGPLRVQVMDNNACTLDTIFRIAAMTPECVPNVFTPNNDQMNDFWNLEQAYLYSDSEIKVWGRFGRKVFESIGYENPWDGKTENGNDVPDGVYYYHIELGNGYDPIQGTVTILR